MDIAKAFAEARDQLHGVMEPREIESVLRIVFEDVFGWTPGNASRSFSPAELLELNQVIGALTRQQPVQYILGEADFYGFKFRVNESVLIPRPETEELVFLILETVRSTQTVSGKILDIGTGSGCIPIVLKKKLPDTWEVVGLDVSTAALEVARDNGARLGAAVNWIEADILDTSAWPDMKGLWAVVSNPPYIPPSERSRMGASTLGYEPELALFVPEEDPLLFYRSITAFAEKALLPGGYLFFELNDTYAAQMAAQVVAHGFDAVEVFQDMQGFERMLRARKPYPTMLPDS